MQTEFCAMLFLHRQLSGITMKLNIEMLIIYYNMLFWYKAHKNTDRLQMTADVKKYVLHGGLCSVGPCAQYYFELSVWHNAHSFNGLLLCSHIYSFVQNQDMSHFRQEMNPCQRNAENGNKRAQTPSIRSLGNAFHAEQHINNAKITSK